jgi:hypothetical protein
MKAKFVEDVLNEGAKEKVAKVQHAGDGSTITLWMGKKSKVYHVTEKDDDNEKMWKKVEKLAKSMGATHIYDADSSPKKWKINESVNEEIKPIHDAFDYDQCDFAKQDNLKKMNQKEGIKLLSLIDKQNKNVTDFRYSEAFDEINYGAADCLDFMDDFKNGRSALHAYLSIGKIRGTSKYLIKMNTNWFSNGIQDQNEEIECESLEEVAYNFSMFLADIQDSKLNG